MRNSWFLPRFSWAMWCFYVNCLTVLWEEFLAGAKQVGRYLAENRYMVFFWKIPGKRTCDIFLEWMLKRSCNVLEGYIYTHTYTNMNGVVWYWFILPLFAYHHHLLWLHETKCTKDFLVVFLVTSCHLCWFRIIGRPSWWILNQPTVAD